MKDEEYISQGFLSPYFDVLVTQSEMKNINDIELKKMHRRV